MIDCPKFTGKEEEYFLWRRRINLWLEIRKDVAKYPALEIRMALEGEAFFVVMDIPREQLKGSDGIKIILEKLDEAYKNDSQMNKLKKAKALFDIERKRDENIREFIFRFEKISSDCERAGGGKMSDEMMGCHLLDKAKINRLDVLMVLRAWEEELNYENVKRVLNIMG